MTVDVVITRLSRAHYRGVDAWWRMNRPKSPELFSNEFRRSVNLIAHAPQIGQSYEAPESLPLRRYFLQRTGHHVYYRFDERKRCVTVLGIWNAASGSEPNFV